MAAWPSKTRVSAQKLGQHAVPKSRCCATAGFRIALPAGEGQRPGAGIVRRKICLSEMDKRHQELVPGHPGAVRPTDDRSSRTTWRLLDGLGHTGERPATGLTLRLVARRHDLRRLDRNPAEYHRRARARPAPRAASGPRGMTPFLRSGFELSCGGGVAELRGVAVARSSVGRW